MKKQLMLILLGCGLAYGLDSQNISRIEYFIDSDPGFGKATAVSVTQSVDVSASFSPNVSVLPVGIHNLFVRSQDANGSWSVTNASMFYCVGNMVNPNISRIEYFFDIDPGFGKATAVSFTPSADVAIGFSPNISTLAAGIHNLYVRSQDANGIWSVTNTNLIYSTGNQMIPNITRIEYFFDTDPGFGKAISLPITPASDIANSTYNLNTSTLSLGTHQLMLRSLDASGNWSITNSLSFTKSVTELISLCGDISAGYKVFPNPSHELFHLQYPSDQTIKRINLIDMSGSSIQVKIFNQLNEKQIDVSGIKPGNYFISIVSDKGLVYKKVIVDQ